MNGRANDDKGYALVLALLAVGLLSAVCSILVLKGRSTAIETDLFLQKIAESAALEAATTRLTHAFEGAGDRVTQSLDRAGRASWAFGDEQVRLTRRGESGSVDLNVGAPDLLAAVLREFSFDRTLAASLTEAIMAARTENRPIPSIDALIRPCQRLRPDVARLRAVTTTLTRTPTVDPREITKDAFDLLTRGASDATLKSLGDALASPNAYVADGVVNVGPPVFTIAAEVVTRGEPGRRRELVLRFDGETRRWTIDRKHSQLTLQDDHACL